MKPVDTPLRFSFTEKLHPAVASDGDAPWAFVVLPKSISNLLPRRGRTTVDVTLNGHVFRQTLEPDGQLSHWLCVSQNARMAAGVGMGEAVSIAITPVNPEPEPETPADLLAALAVIPRASAAWADTTTLARLDWIHWITSAKRARTRVERVRKTCDQLVSGHRRVCCFDPSGHYSKAFRAPRSAD